jgi:hypothetical protein
MADTPGVSKRALFWCLAGAVMFFCYLAAAYAGHDQYMASRCVGLWSLYSWFHDWCSDLLLPRLAVMAIGFIPSAILGYFAEKNTPHYHRLMRGTLQNGAQNASYGLANDGYYWCRDCSFESKDVAAIHEHRGVLRIGTTAVTNNSDLTYGLAPPTQPSVASPASSAISRRTPTPQRSEPEFKTCPDCAEQVRYAARKCRFCGFEFEAASIT